MHCRNYNATKSCYNAHFFKMNEKVSLSRYIIGSVG